VAASESEPEGAMEPMEPALATLPLLPTTDVCCEPIEPGAATEPPTVEPATLVETLPVGVAAEAPGLADAAALLPAMADAPEIGTVALDPGAALTGTGGAAID